MAKKILNVEESIVQISATVSRTIEISKQWYKFEYSEARTVDAKNKEKEKKKLWADCIDEVEIQIDALKKFLGI